MNSYQQLEAWRRSMELSVLIYQVTNQFPGQERYGLVSQMRRAAVSVPSNIAEGYRRASPRERRRFIQIAYGSASELETQLEIAKRLKFGKTDMMSNCYLVLNHVLRLLNGLNRSLAPTKE